MDPACLGAGMTLPAARYAFFRHIYGKVNETNPVADLIELSRQCHGFIAHEHICFILERPAVMQLDEDNRLHSLAGQALAYRDGWGIHAMHGTVVPSKAVEAPDTITLDEIDNEPNEEIREALLRCYGAERVIEARGATRITVDKCGMLLVRPFKSDGEPLVMVKVRNRTPEPDGSRKQYYLRVPPWVDSPQEGIAWTFGLECDQYAPVVES
jgi:hypothetical protein